jgi:hypothetical protein
MAIKRHHDRKFISKLTWNIFFQLQIHCYQYHGQLIKYIENSLNFKINLLFGNIRNISSDFDFSEMYNLISA